MENGNKKKKKKREAAALNTLLKVEAHLVPG